MVPMVRLAAGMAGGLLITATLLADEGMWLFNRPPREAIRARYGYELTDTWLEHLQKSSIRFGRFGSAAFVSPDGLILTNHHVGLDCITVSRAVLASDCQSSDDGGGLPDWTPGREGKTFVRNR